MSNVPLFEVAPAAPIAGGAAIVAGITGALILLGVAWIMLFGLQQMYKYTFGAAFLALAALLNFGPFHIGDATVGKLDKLVTHAIGSGLSACEYAAGRLWYSLGYTVRTTAYATQMLAHATWQAITALSHAAIPNAVTHVIQQTVVKPAKGVAALRAQVVSLSRYAHAHVGALEHDLARDFGQAWKGIDHVRTRANKGAAALAGAIAIPGLRLGQRNLRHRLTKVETKLHGKAFAGAVAAALGVLGLTWTRKKCTKRNNDLLCKTDFGALEALLAGAVLIVGAQSVHQFAETMTSVEDEMVGVLEKLVIELRELA